MDGGHVVVLTDAGKVSCAGADFQGRASVVIKDPADLLAYSLRTRENLQAILECTKPVACRC